MILKFADIFFVVFHTALIFFNVFGWVWKKTRKANLITLLLTAGSWFILGIFYGIGYCPLTEWHFNVLEKLGKTGLPLSYIEYLAERLSGMDFSSDLVNNATMIVFIIALLASVTINWIDHRNKGKK